MTGANFKLFNFFGVPVNISLFSFLITAILVFPIAERHGAVVATGVVVGLLLSILLHEMAHAFVGMRVGAKVLGIQLDMLGGATLFQHKAPSYFKDVAISISGPATNFILWQLLEWGYNTMLNSRGPNTSIELVFIMFYLSFYNLFLGILNAMPGFPLDGGQVVHSFAMGITRHEKFSAGITLALSSMVSVFLLYYFVLNGRGNSSVSIGWVFWLFIIFWIMSSSISLWQQANTQIGFAPTSRQKDEKQQEEAQKRAKSHPGHTIFEQGRAHMLAREYTQAINAFNQALQLEPNEGAYLDYRAYTYVEMGEYNFALQDYNNLLQIAPQRDDYYSARAQLYQKVGNFAAAAADADYALSLNSLNAQAMEIKRAVARS